MSIWEKTKMGLKTIKWMASKNGREYRKEQKANREGVKLINEHNNEINKKEIKNV